MRVRHQNWCLLDKPAAIRLWTIDAGTQTMYIQIEYDLSR